MKYQLIILLSYLSRSTTQSNSSDRNNYLLNQLHKAIDSNPDSGCVIRLNQGKIYFDISGGKWDTHFFQCSADNYVQFCFKTNSKGAYFNQLSNLTDFVWTYDTFKFNIKDYKKGLIHLKSNI